TTQAGTATLHKDESYDYYRDNDV
ncbi:MAG: hypothetical protein RI947_631, partial [Candidatus Parcubacteria bacterium]